MSNAVDTVDANVTQTSPVSPKGRSLGKSPRSPKSSKSTKLTKSNSQPVYISRIGFRSDKGPSQTETWFLIILVLVIVIVLLYLEYADHDCMRGKKCSHRKPNIQPGDTREEAVQKVIEMVKSNNNFVIWRQALIVAVILPIPLVYLLYSRFPTLLEWLFVTLIIFMAMYLALSWLWAHYFNPNAQTIESNLEKLINND